MSNPEKTFPIDRRRLLEAGLLLSASHALPPAAAAVPPAQTVRDKFWIWGHPAGSHDKDWGLPASSRITPVEAAHYMGIPNAIFVRYEGDPEPPFDQYALPFHSLREVVWSVVGAAGATDVAERDHVIDLAKRSSNFSGVMMDDFFTGAREGKLAALTIDQLKQVQRQLKDGRKKLDLWVVLYDRQVKDPVGPHVSQCDVVTFWTWEARNIGNLNRDFAKAEQLAPNARKVLGCYMWDYGTKQPMPVSVMERQCEVGLEWLHEGRIDGMIFLASCIGDLGLETVEWTRRWIEKVGGQSLHGA